MTPPVISVVVCTRNRRALLSRTIESLAALETTGLPGHEIVVIDDGSTDDTETLVRVFAGRAVTTLRYVRQQGGGIARARNRGIAEARGEWIAFIDDDERASSGWLASLYRTALDTGTDIIGGPVLLELPPSAPIVPRGTVRKLLGENPGMARPRNSRNLLYLRPVMNLPGGGNVLIRRRVFEQTGGFDPARIRGEDMDMFRRALRAGYRIDRAPGAIVHHMLEPHRLSPEHLWMLASNAGEDLARSDAEERGRLPVVATAMLRVLHALLITLPRFAVARMRGDHDDLAVRRCSLIVMRRYLATALKGRNSSRHNRRTTTPHHTEASPS